MNNRVETWRPVPFFEGYYEISDCGRVRRMARGSGTRPGRLVKLHVDKRGYQYFCASVHKVVTRLSVHRSAAWAFLGPPAGGKIEVNHKDGDKTNNKIGNLEWCSRAENCRHAYRTGLRSDQRPVIQFDSFNRVVARFQSLAEASRATGVNINCIVSVCKGRRHTAGGFIWKYAKERLDG